MHYGTKHAEYMYPAFKINKDFELGMLETLTSKNGYTNLAKCELKKNDITAYL